MSTFQTMSVYVWPIRLVTQYGLRQLDKSLMRIGFCGVMIDALNFTLSVSQSDLNARESGIMILQKCIEMLDCATDKLQTKEVSHD